VAVDLDIFHIWFKLSTFNNVLKGVAWPFVDQSGSFVTYPLAHKYIFSRSCQLEEFRILPLGGQNLTIDTKIELNFDIGGGKLSLIKHEIKATDSDRNDPKKFDMQGIDPISPAKGTRMWVDQLNNNAVGFRYSIWGRWT